MTSHCTAPTAASALVEMRPMNHMSVRLRTICTALLAMSGRASASTARGLEAAQVAIALDSEHVADLATLVRAAGGAAIGAYQEPLGGRPLLLASLPLNAVQPTPFQRDLSPTHAKRLAAKIDETAAFLDPLIVV